MNNEQQLPPGTELDALVAEALGWRFNEPFYRWEKDVPEGKEYGAHFHTPDPYSTDGDWMLTALDWLKEKREPLIIEPSPKGWSITLRFNADGARTLTSKTLEHAVALAVVEAAERMPR